MAGESNVGTVVGATKLPWRVAGAFILTSGAGVTRGEEVLDFERSLEGLAVREVTGDFRSIGDFSISAIKSDEDLRLLPNFPAWFKAANEK